MSTGRCTDMQTSLFEAFKDTSIVLDRMILKATSMALESYVFSEAKDQARVLLQKAHDSVGLSRRQPFREAECSEVPLCSSLARTKPCTCVTRSDSALHRCAALALVTGRLSCTAHAELGVRTGVQEGAVRAAEESRL